MKSASFLDGRRLTVESSRGMSRWSPSASAVFLDSDGTEHELTRMTHEGADVMLANTAVPLDRSVTLRQGLVLRYGMRRQSVHELPKEIARPEEGYTSDVSPARTDWALVVGRSTVVGRVPSGLSLEKFFDDLSETAFDTDEDDMAVVRNEPQAEGHGPARRRGLTLGRRLPPELVHHEEGVAVVELTPRGEHPVRSEGVKVAGGEMFRRDSPGGTVFVLANTSSVASVAPTSPEKQEASFELAADLRVAVGG